MATEAERQRIEAIRRVDTTHAFPRQVKVTLLDGSVDFINPTENQGHILDALHASLYTYVDKYRQSMSSTVHVADLLRRIMYRPGRMGMVIGDKEDTYKELLRRMAGMYRSLAPLVRVPLARDPSSEAIVFNNEHEGVIQGVTGGSENPAIGFSPDDAVVSEYGLYPFPETFDAAFFPAINRRPNASVRIETTPGVYGSPQHKMWEGALRGEGRFKALFLAWWRDPTCISHDPAMPPDWRPDEAELEYARKLDVFDKASLGKPWYPYKRHQPVAREQLWFRRISLQTEFHGDERLFDNKYPPDPWSGWLVGSSPTIPIDALAHLRATAREVPEGEEVFIEEREPGAPYLITGDGAGYGNTGDPAGLVLWNLWDWRPVGMFLGREDPGVLARRVMRWQARYGAHVIVETNKDGLAAALVTAGCPMLHWSGDQPGWFSSEVSKGLAKSALIDMLRAREIPIEFEPILRHLSTWDGSTRRAGSGKKRHHFELAICCLIFAYGVQALGVPRRPKPKPKVELRWTADTLDELFKKKDTHKGRVLGQA